MRHPVDESGPEFGKPLRGLVVAYRVVLVLLTVGLVKGAHGLVTGEIATLLPSLQGWMRALPTIMWAGLVISVFGLWRWRWWGFQLSLAVAAVDLAVELYGGGFGLHVLRIPVAAVLLIGLCIPLRSRFQAN